MKFDSSNVFKIGQYFVIAAILGVITSPPIANFFIAISFIWAIACNESRRNILLFLCSKPGYFFLSFFLILFSGLIYGVADKQEIASSLWGWRKIIMLPIATSFFINQPNAKKCFANFFWKICLLFATYSFIEYLFLGKDGVVLRNYVTQALIFSIAILILLINLLGQQDKFERYKIFHIISIAYFICNIAYTSPGRSGYVALIVMTISCLALYPNISIHKRIYVGVLAISVTLCVLLTVPASNHRIQLAYQEAIASQTHAEGSSLGLRIIFWKTTINMIPKNFFWGVGTGGFESAYKQEIIHKSGAEATITGDPHNQYMKIIAEQGVFGVLIFISLLFFLAKQKSEYTGWLIGFCTLIAWCITSLTNAHFSTFNEGQFIWIWLGIFLAPCNSKIMNCQN